MRKEIDVAIVAEGRDQGKIFHLTEMPAMRAEKLAGRALFLLAQAGIDVPQNILSGGASSIALIGIQALLRIPFDAAEPLFDELMTCVKIKEPAVTRSLTPDDIEEVATFFTLRGEVLKLHMGFSSAGAA